MTLERHSTNYRPLLPKPKIFRTRGAINQTVLVIIWLWWVLSIELG